MNILPKKRWHVRTKENIARVRKDEAEAAEKERQEKQRIENADREARLGVLKHKSKQKLEENGIVETEKEPEPQLNHVNLFENLDRAVASTNKDHDKEVKEKKEEYEKKIGYLTYLGQDTNEALGKKNWYEVLPESSRFSRTSDIKDTYDKLVLKDSDGIPRKRETDTKDGEVSWKAKQRLDPINAFRKYCFQSKKSDQSSQKSVNNTNGESKFKSEKTKRKGIEDKAIKLQKMREARLKREQQEKSKTELFLKSLNGPVSSPKEKDNEVKRVKPKYNSQFNPELARQNYR